MPGSPVTPPGLLIAAPSSGSGKTTIALGLMRALSTKGLHVQPFKCGPDYIDPAFHRAATGQSSFNLDLWAMDEATLAAVFSNAHGADLCIAEGAMGLFDGAAEPGLSGIGSSAELAARMGWPVLLVLDIARQAQSAGSIALGCATFSPKVPIAGVILNRVASPHHATLARQGLEQAGLPVLGVVPNKPDLALPDRHLGLVQAGEHNALATWLDQCAALVADHCDLEAIQNAAGGATHTDRGRTLPSPPAQRIAVAQDVAFSFIYPHMLEHWRKAGAEIVPFSPLADEAPHPDADLVWLPGGYPELHAGTLAAASTFLGGLRQHAKTRPIHGECGGYMVLGQTLIDKDGTANPMAGLLGLVTSFADRKRHLGYRRATLIEALPGHRPGAVLRGHEFHYASLIEQPDAPFAAITDAQGQPVAETGSRRGQVTGTFFHLIATETA